MNVMPFEDLAVLSNRALEGIFRSAIMPPPETLVSYEWRGYNIASFTRLLGIQKFIKGFFLLNGRVEGYNIQAQQNGLTEPWLYQPSAKTLKHYAFYVVTPVDPSSHDNLYPQALFLNYGASPRNPRLAVERPIRDYLAQPDPHNPNLLLGKAYLALGSCASFPAFSSSNVCAVIIPKNSRTEIVHGYNRIQ